MNDDLQIYAGTAGHSVWFSDDLGLNWVHPNSQSGMYLETRVWAMTSHSGLPEFLFAGTDDGIYRWNEGPARWTKLPSPMTDVWAITQDPADPLTLLAGTRPAALYRSQDGGATWEELAVPGISKFSEVNMGPTRVTQILFDPVDKDTVWATIEIGGIYRSDDRGRSWTMVSDGLVSNDVHGIAVTRDSDGRKRMLASTNRGLHTSGDNGQTWHFQSLDSPWQYTRAVIVRPDDPSVVFLANGNGPPGDQGRLLRSMDGGSTWADVHLPGSLNSTTWCVAMHESRPSLIFACTNLGQVFRSLDGGDSWVRMPHEFGEIRSLHWRPLPPGTRRAEHSVTRPATKIHVEAQVS